MSLPFMEHSYHQTLYPHQPPWEDDPIPEDAGPLRRGWLRFRNWFLR